MAPAAGSPEVTAAGLTGDAALLPAPEGTPG